MTEEIKQKVYKFFEDKGFDKKKQYPLTKFIKGYLFLGCYEYTPGETRVYLTVSSGNEYALSSSYVDSLSFKDDCTDLEEQLQNWDGYKYLFDEEKRNEIIEKFTEDAEEKFIDSLVSALECLSVDRIVSTIETINILNKYENIKAIAKFANTFQKILDNVKEE